MTLSSFRANPRLGHLNHCKHIYGYLYAAIRIRVDEPDYSALPTKVYDWLTWVLLARATTTR
jgi:hypothetical protein